MEKKTWWRACEVDLNNIEKLVFKSLLRNWGCGVNKLGELKELGDIKLSRYGVNVSINISKEKRISMFFAKRYNVYEYRHEVFYEIPKVEM